MNPTLMGEPVILELVSTDLTTAAAITMRNAGSNTVRTIQAEERLIIQVLGIADISGNAIDVFDDANNNGTVDANERLVSVADRSALTDKVLDFNWQFGPSTDGGLSCGKGRMPKVKAGAVGTIKVFGVGAIVKG